MQCQGQGAVVDCLNVVEGMHFYEKKKGNCDYEPLEGSELRFVMPKWYVICARFLI